MNNAILQPFRRRCGDNSDKILSDTANIIATKPTITIDPLGKFEAMFTLPSFSPEENTERVAGLLQRSR
jgi:hypothetical protein